MKDKIIELRSQGKTYKQIQDILGCSKSTISYHCGNNQKEKTLNRTRKRRLNIIKRRIDSFHNRKAKNLKEGLRKFQKSDNIYIKGNRYINPNIELSFNYTDVINLYGEETICYLSGKKINLLTDTDYNLDHIIPIAKGGSNSLSNMGITDSTVNRMKTNLTVKEFISKMIEILEYNGYEIKMRESAIGSQ